MNLCILLGKIVSEIEFKFIIKSKNNSIAYFELELLNKSIVKVKAYNKMADYVYNKLENGNIILINGEVRIDGTVEINKIWQKH